MSKQVVVVAMWPGYWSALRDLGENAGEDGEGRNCGSVSEYTMRAPMRRTRSGCCACAASGHAAAPPSADMNCRRAKFAVMHNTALIR